jgi:hypothetical protein
LQPQASQVLLALTALQQEVQALLQLALQARLEAYADAC